MVWLYPAEEPRTFAADDRNTPLLTGRTPETLGSRLGTGIDLRPRNWRTRQLDFMLHRAEDPWARAGAVASLLAPPHVSEAVPDAYDRSHLNRFRRPPASHGAPGSPAGAPPRSPPPRTGSAGAGNRRAGARHVPRPAGPVAARKPVTYRARNNPSWTTDTSIRPSRS
ncbi:DUF6397 family protein [Streptomyces sp. NPDC000348]|uniref:DUF6397 family protein n=1 Tax=Streptomyces sp. NPDC000348 TaxID=3364538 RepID=UPI0036855A98